MDQDQLSHLQQGFVIGNSSFYQPPNIPRAPARACLASCCRRSSSANALVKGITLIRRQNPNGASLLRKAAGYKEPELELGLETEALTMQLCPLEYSIPSQLFD